MATNLVQLPSVERLSSRVIRILGGNPGKFTLQGTNTYLVGQGANRILIDSGQGIPVWIQSLKTVLAEEKATIDRTILTHWHHDHTSGVEDLLKISPSTVIFKNEPSEKQADIKDGQVFATEGATLRAFHCPGHTTDHMALILEEEDAMFTGDNVLGHGTAVFEDYASYMKSLERMQHQFSGRGYPGHGAVIEDGKSKIQEYIKHRQEREQQILTVLSQDNAGKGNQWTSLELTKVIYKDVPENLHVPAEGGVRKLLKKLEQEGKVSQDANSTKWQLDSKASL
ncbi:metallo-beta-lactamase superfamily protein [Delphinella strobiligena]|nr:metallo-beta-lactamase superfamily protein [Delphinella strobiligena]